MRPGRHYHYFLVFTEELLLRKTVINVHTITARNSMYYIC